MSFETELLGAVDVSDLDAPRSLPSLAERDMLASYELEATYRWLLRAPPGARRVYHEGHLGRDRFRDPSVQKVAMVMGWASLVGLVVPTQRRLSQDTFNEAGGLIEAGVCEYQAHRTSVVWHLPMPLFDQRGRWRDAGNLAAMGMEVADA